MSENKATTLTVHTKDVIGSKKYSSAAMLSLQFEGSEEIHDIFLTDELMNSLHNGTARVLQYNNKK